jgi:hypothetical protein
MKTLWCSLLVSVTATGLLLLVSCSEPEVPQGEAIDFATAHSSPGVLEFTAPGGWQEETPTSRMRRFQYRLPGAAGAAEVAVFAEIGGTAEQNVNRWIGQFSTEEGASVADLAKITNEQVGGLKITVLDVVGVYSGGMAGPMSAQGAGPSPGYRMLAAVIEPGGAPWFVKLTGPEETVSEWESSFYEFVRSAAK